MLKILYIKSLPSVRIDRLKQLPKQPGVYYACSSWRVLYVGMAGDLRKRWAAHHQLDAVKASGGDRLHYRVLPMHWIAYFEAREIAALNPPLNRVRPTPRPTMRVHAERVLLAIGFVLCTLLMIFIAVLLIT
jgi:predicted GIY-YIG superfamily endonuclease